MTNNDIIIKGKKFCLVTDKTDVLDENLTKKFVLHIEKIYQKKMGPDKMFVMFTEEHAYWFKVIRYSEFEFYGRVPLSLDINYNEPNCVLPKNVFLKYFTVEKSYENYLEYRCGFYGKIIGDKVHLFGITDAELCYFSPNPNRYYYSSVPLKSKKFRRIFVGRRVLEENSPDILQNFQKMIGYVEDYNLRKPPFLFIFKKQGKEYWVQRDLFWNNILILFLVTKSGTYEKFRKTESVPGSFMDKHFRNISKNNKGLYVGFSDLTAMCGRNPNSKNFWFLVSDEYDKVITL